MHNSPVRRWAASVLLLALLALAGLPTRGFPSAAAYAEPSTASGPSQREAELSTALRAEQSRVAPALPRSGFPGLFELILFEPPERHASRWDHGQLRSAERHDDQREAIRRVCRRSAPPEAPEAPLGV